MQTKRELYGFVAKLAARHRVGRPSLEAYLLTLWGLARVGSDRAGWTLDEFAELLDRSFGGPAPAFDERWRSDPRWRADAPAPVTGFDRWEREIIGQILDLREMAEANMLTHELRYYGLDAPRGARWFNFDPCSWLESATYGGLRVDDEIVLVVVDWNDFAGFLMAGREHE
jgi:hypothetical protein